MGVGGGGSGESSLRDISPCRGAMLSSLILLPDYYTVDNLEDIDSRMICTGYGSVK